MWSSGLVRGKDWVHPVDPGEPLDEPHPRGAVAAQGGITLGLSKVILLAKFLEETSSIGESSPAKNPEILHFTHTRGANSENIQNPVTSEHSV
jgi:hypothetical protein